MNDSKIAVQLLFSAANPALKISRPVRPVSGSIQSAPVEKRDRIGIKFGRRMLQKISDGIDPLLSFGGLKSDPRLTEEVNNFWDTHKLLRMALANPADQRCFAPKRPPGKNDAFAGRLGPIWKTALDVLNGRYRVGHIVKVM